VETKADRKQVTTDLPRNEEKSWASSTEKSP
jgi:hypothetical protein